MNLRLTACVLLALVMGACGGDSGSDASGGQDHMHDSGNAATSGPTTAPPFAEADAATKLDVTLQDYAFVGVPDSVTGPNVLFTASIKGGNTHQFEIVDHDGAQVAEIPAFEGSGHKVLAVVLQPGTYTVQCLIKEGARTHAQLGMKKDFTVN